jgi:RimJ/RimL family protein N-acetyltransferase
MDEWADRALDRTAERTLTGKIPNEQRGPEESAPGAAALSPVAYPWELERTVTLRDGARVRMRPIRPEDEARLVDLYSRLSEYTAYQRFFTAMRRLPPDWFHYFANVDYARRLALIAENGEGDHPELIAVGRYEPSETPDSAEVAFVVQDGWQGRGLGALLLDQVLAAAEARGIRRFVAFVLPDNRRMLDLIAGRTDVDERHTEDGVTTVRFRRRRAARPRPSDE